MYFSFKIKKKSKMSLLVISLFKISICPDSFIKHMHNVIFM